MGDISNLVVSIPCRQSVISIRNVYALLQKAEANKQLKREIEQTKIAEEQRMIANEQYKLAQEQRKLAVEKEVQVKLWIHYKYASKRYNITQ